MAPEMAKLQTLSKASDIWSLGVVLYSLLDDKIGELDAD